MLIYLIVLIVELFIKVNGNWVDWVQWGLCLLMCNFGMGFCSCLWICMNFVLVNNGIDCVGSGMEIGFCIVIILCLSKIVLIYKSIK